MQFKLGALGALRLDLLCTLDFEREGVLDFASVVLGHAGVVCVVLGAKVVNPEDRLVISDLGDGDVAVGGEAVAARNEQPVVAVPLQVDGQVAVRHRAQHRHALSKTQVFPDAELVDCRRNCFFDRKFIHSFITLILTSRSLQTTSEFGHFQLNFKTNMRDVNKKRFVCYGKHVVVLCNKLN